MDDYRRSMLPGSRECVGCGGMTFRIRHDALCPRCAFDAEAMIERIELDGMDKDLQLMTEFEAYYRRREQHRAHETTRISGRPPIVFERDALWGSHLRRTG